MLHYLIKDFKTNFRTHKTMMISIILIQIVSVLIIYSSYGLVNHYKVKANEAEGTSLYYIIESFSDETAEFGQVELFFDEIFSKLERKLNYYYIIGSQDGIFMSSSVKYENGKYFASDELKKSIKSMIPSGQGDIFSESQLNNNENVIIATGDLCKYGEEMTFDGKNYKCIGEISTSVAKLDKEVYFPFQTFPRSVGIYGMLLDLKKPLLESEYNFLVDAIHKYLGEEFYIPEFDGIQTQSDTRGYVGMITVLIALSVICAVNYCIIYNYILESKRKNYSIIQICGAGKRIAISTYFSEMVILLLTTFLIGVVVFDKLLRKWILNVFEYADYFYNCEVYLKLGVVYIVISAITFYIMILRYVSKPLIKVLREG